MLTWNGEANSDYSGTRESIAETRTRKNEVRWLYQRNSYEFRYDFKKSRYSMPSEQHDYLRRLPAAYYRGQAYVHWSMTMAYRRIGWLIPPFHNRFREILTHAAFRYGFCCPIYCCMPDHLHMLWAGHQPTCDQRNAVRFLRQQLNVALASGFELQKQPYDHVLRDDERQPATFERVAEYIARNPERAGLVPVDGFRTYPYTGCLVPGYPDLSPWRNDYWMRFWSLYSRLSKSV